MVDWGAEADVEEGVVQVVDREGSKHRESIAPGA